MIEDDRRFRMPGIADHRGEGWRRRGGHAKVSLGEVQGTAHLLSTVGGSWQIQTVGNDERLISGSLAPPYRGPCSNRPRGLVRARSPTSVGSVMDPACLAAGVLLVCGGGMPRCRQTRGRGVPFCHCPCVFCRETASKRAPARALRYWTSLLRRQVICLTGKLLMCLSSPICKNNLRLA